MKDPLKGSAWSEAGTVAGFATSPPNQTLMRFARQVRAGAGGRAVDIGCGAGRNSVPLAELQWNVVGLDLSWPMLEAARVRALVADTPGRIETVLAPMERLPLLDATADLVVAHGIWNLASSTGQFREAVREAARVARPGAALFVFTFSRTTIPIEALPVEGERFVFTEFSGARQCFLTREQLLEELGSAGFVPDDAVPLTEHNRPKNGEHRKAGPPVIWEGAFRRAS